MAATRPSSLRPSQVPPARTSSRRRGRVRCAVRVVLEADELGGPLERGRIRDFGVLLAQSIRDGQDREKLDDSSKRGYARPSSPAEPEALRPTPDGRGVLRRKRVQEEPVTHRPLPGASSDFSLTNGRKRLGQIRVQREAPQ